MSSDFGQETIRETADDEEIEPNEIHDDDDRRKSTTSVKKYLRRYDSLDLESAKVASHHGRGSQAVEWSVILQLAFQSIGVVYGDIGTSPLYVYASTFSEGINHKDDILGVLSLIFYTITLIPLIKYVFIVLRANDNGEGGTFALYSLICRYARVGLIPSQQAEDHGVSNFQLELPSKRLTQASRIKSMLEKTLFAKIFLLIITMLGTSMVIGDGVLTPCISVLSAVGGIKRATVSMTEAILVCLFMVQRYGTDKVGYSFAPIIFIWFTFIAGIGVYNFIKFDPTVIKAINPVYIVDYFRRNKKDAWVSLGGVVLAITGTEALFADVGHFTVRSIQISMCSITYPALILPYTGQASFLRKHEHFVSDTFFKSIPGPLYWPMFVVAVAAAIIASQAMISGTFSIIQQSLSLGCFPRVKIVSRPLKRLAMHMLCSNYLNLSISINRKKQLVAGIAVVFVMTLTSSFLVLMMIMIWKTNILFVITYVLVIGTVELVYLSSVLYKFGQGGYLPLAFAVGLMTVMYVWNYVYRKKYNFELDHKISVERLKEIITADTNLCRIPGLAMFYSELVHGIPPIFEHYVANVPALHSVLVFVSIKSLPISKVAAEERFLFRRVEPKELNVFRCVVRYGYTDIRNEQDSFEWTLVERLKEFIKDNILSSHVLVSNGKTTKIVDREENERNVEEEWRERIDREISLVDKAWEAGVVHLIGENEVISNKGAGIGKRVIIDYAYIFLKKNLRQSEKVFDIPHKRMLKVGMTYEL
ncbi:potassium transporter [Corchorus olitorius]|uniref:Potassium transporter n=1 Tax=Corchorus olitorius TaxID=93759 RepID=A0A1R3L404_9ROSI|nr:potassium transporter [Corchorus olitorius]